MNTINRESKVIHLWRRGGAKLLSLLVGLLLLLLSSLPTPLYADLGERSVWFPADSDSTHSVAWGDVDGDGDLDLAAACPVFDGILKNICQKQDHPLSSIAGWTLLSSETDSSACQALFSTC